MTDTVPALVFWISAGLIAYAYVGYPVLLSVLGRLRQQPTIQRDIWPTVSLLVPAYNEADTIKEKIRTCVELEYPKDRLEVFVASDGSTDSTATVLEEATRAGMIRGVVFPKRRGKAAVINDLVGMASGEILVISDATSTLDRGSLRALASNFADPRVGCVSGVYQVVIGTRDGKSESEALYVRYETRVRHLQTRLGKMLVAHGQLFAFRRALFEPLEVGTRNEDFIIPVTILMKGYKSIHDTRAIAWEDAREMTGYSRRVSQQAGNYQQLALFWKMRGWLREPFLVFQVLSHKVLRLLTPFLLLGTYASSAWLMRSPVYRIAFAAQTLFFVAAVLGTNARLRRKVRALVAGPYYFCMVNVAGLAALHRILWRKGPIGHARTEERELAA